MTNKVHDEIKTSQPPCGRCGGLHFGSYKCPYLDEARCHNCGEFIASERGADPNTHPNRKFDELGNVYHAGCCTVVQVPAFITTPYPPTAVGVVRWCRGDVDDKFIVDGVQRMLDHYSGDPIRDLGYEQIIERDRSAVSKGVLAINRRLQSYQLLIGDGGSRQWDDDRWHIEFNKVCESIVEALKPLQVIAADLTNCPTKPTQFLELVQVTRELMAVINSVPPRTFTTDAGMPTSAEAVYGKAERLLSQIGGQE